MKSLFFAILFLPSANAKITNEFPQPHKNVISRCHLLVDHHDGEKWNSQLDQYFEQNDPMTNMINLLVRIVGEDYMLRYVYNRKGTTWMTTDPMPMESVYINLKRNRDNFEVARSHFSAIDEMELPTKFLLRDDFHNEEGTIILRVKCNTEKVLSEI